MTSRHSFFVRKAIQESKQRQKRSRFPLSEIHLDEQGAPDGLSSKEIRAFLQDRGRQLLPTAAAECVEQAAHWKQILHHLESTGQGEAAIAARANHLLWRHRLRILEMIADAQFHLDFQ